MSNVTIGELPAAGSITGTELLELEQSGTSVKTAMNAMIALPYYAQTSAESGASVTPTNYTYQPGDLRRYGGTGGPTGSIPSTDDSTAWATAVSTGLVVLPAGWAFKVVTGATHTGQIIIIGQGQTSQIYSDTVIVTVTSGTGSICDNFWMGNITAPWIVSRNPANIRATISYTSLVQSSTQLGYQPTVNDLEYTTWVANIPAVGTQNIGPTLLFKGAASGINVSRITGRFVLVIIQDAINSTIHDCDVRGGKGQWGTLQFDNWTNGIQRGSHNRAFNNRVQYGSFSGIYFGSNDNFEERDNHCFLNGESGTKTLQAQGTIFSASIGGATTGTITTPVGGFSNGTWTFIFVNGQTRTVTITGNTTATWTGALTAGNSSSATVYNTTLNPQNFYGKITGNYVYQNYYDGIDADSTYDTTVDTALTHHEVSGNYSFQNGGDGINADGSYNSYTGNHIYLNGAFGFWGYASFSQITGNMFDSNNQAGGGSVADLLVGGQGSNYVGNYINFAGTGYPIYSPGAAGTVPNVASDNVTIGGTNFWGNSELVYTILNNNIDATTGARTWQTGLIILRNSAGTLQHIFYSDVSTAQPANASRIIGNTSGGYTNTPTGTDASTAFAAGAKISTTDTNGIILNTANQNNLDVGLQASVVINTTTTTLTVSVSFESFSVNSVTQYRPILRFWNAATGAAFVLNTTNIGASTDIQVAFTGYLS